MFAWLTYSSTCEHQLVVFLSMCPFSALKLSIEGLLCVDFISCIWFHETAIILCISVTIFIIVAITLFFPSQVGCYFLITWNAFLATLRSSSHLLLQLLALFFIRPSFSYKETIFLGIVFSSSHCSNLLFILWLKLSF